MKKFISILAVLFFCQVLVAQNISGEAIYFSQKKSKFSKNSSDETERNKAKRLARLYEKEMQLIFNAQESFYKELPTLASDKNAAYRAGALAVGGYSSSGIYKNLRDSIFVEQREFLGKQFLVKDTLSKIEWTITEESKQIGKYVVIRATAPVMINVDNFKVPNSDVTGTFIATAWFTPQIPVSNGPELFQGLPGLILELNLSDTTILCTKITLTKDTQASIKPETVGEDVTLKEYKKIVLNKMIERKN